MAKALFIAEKSSLRRSVEAAYQNHKSEFTDEIIFSEMSGHLVTLKLPSEMEPNLPRDWSSIPFLPEEHGGWQYKVIEEKNPKYKTTAKDRFDIIKGLLDKENFDYIIHAGDPDQEGELLVNLLLTYLNNTLPIKRYWANTTVESQIADALHNLRDEKTDPMLINLLKAGYARQHTDYRFGMNLSSAASIKMSGRAAVGRVKTVMLHIVCQREEAIRNFKPSTSYGVKSLYKCGTEGILHDSAPRGDENEENESSGITTYENKSDAQTLISMMTGKTGTVTAYDVKVARTQPPKLFKLSQAQVKAGKMGYSTKDSASTIQHLYEMGFLSYPRTSCDLLGSGEDFRGLLDSAAVIPELTPFVRQITDADIERVKKNKKWVDDKAIQAEGHTALCPTVNHIDISSLSKMELDIYTMICRQFVSIFLPPVSQEKTSMVVDIDGNIFVSNGKTLIDPGYSKIFGSTFTDTLIPKFAVGDTIEVSSFDITEHTTVCPSHLSDTDLVGICENPAKYLDDMSLKSLGKRLCVGTEATRTETIMTLVNKDKYLEFKKTGKKEYLCPTAVGQELNDNLSGCSITKVDVTGHLEEKLDMVRHGKLSFDDMEQESVKVMMQMLDEIKNASMKPLSSSATTLGVCPCCGKSIISGKKVYFCTGYKDGCQFVIGKTILGANITETDVKSLLAGKTIHKKLEKDERKWEQDLRLNESHEIEFVKDARRESKYACPLCGGKLMESKKNYLCSNYKHDDENSCHFYIPKEICGVPLLDADVQALLQSGKTRILKGFVGKNKKKFDAALEIKDGKIKFKFPEAKTTGLSCPECGTELLETQYGYVCPKHKKDDESSCRFLGVAHEICGKKIDINLVKKLLTDRKTALLSGFKSKKGKDFKAALILTDGKVELEFDQGTAPVSSSYHCPCCGMGMTENEMFIKCSCGFTLWKTMAKKRLSDTEIREIITNGSTSGPVFGFKSKKGKSFSSRLYVDKAEKNVKFDFS